MPGITQRHLARAGVQWGYWLALPAVFLWVSTLAAQVAPDQQADMVLNSARKAYNEKNYPFAIARFREFLSKFAGHKEAPSARYGLALVLLDSPEKDYAGAVEQLQPLAGLKDFAEHPPALYYLGLAQRGLGTRELALAVAKPNEAAQHRSAANQRFEEAARQFAAASEAFTARVKDPNPQAKELPLDLEWAARARCDQAEMLLRLARLKEAQATAAPFVKDPLLTRSRYCSLGRYYHGFASFLLQDYLTAGRSLNMLTPFTEPVFGLHARYLLARVHHLADEHAEAAEQYAAVVADYDQGKKDAAEALKHPERFKDNPDEKARLEALLKDPAPDYVARSAFFAGVLFYEEGRFADALAHFAALAQQYPGSVLLPEAQLRQGFCQVQLKQFADAVKTLQPLADKEPRLADQAIFWIAKAQVGAADPNNPPAYDQALKAALDTFRKAADKAQQLTASDPEARTRRGEILLELADTQQLAKQYREAAAVYGQILNDKVLPQREEEMLERQAAALNLAGDYNGSDQLCVKFQQAYPKSPLLGAVFFRYAENAYFRALAAEQAMNQPNRQQELAGLNAEVSKRYQVLVDKFPEFPLINLARYGLALAFYRQGDLEKAKDTLETIPQADRSGELAVVPYVMADCLIRLTPTKAEDALTSGKIQEQLQAAIELLDGFIAGAPTSPQTPDALLKLGLCHQRLAVLLVQPEEHVKALAGARSAYEKLMQQFPASPLRPQAVYERAKCLAQAGDLGGAVNELQRFKNDPLKTASVAPMALLELATLLRKQNKAAEAADVLAQARQQHEPTLLKDPARAEWVLLLQYHQALALKEAGKPAEARGLFDQVARQYSSRPEGADAALRWGQCLMEEGLQKLAAARKVLASGNVKPQDQAAADRTSAEGLKAVEDAVRFLEGQVNQLKEKQPTWEVRARMLYETAWGYRTLAEPEVAAARKKLKDEVPLSAVPLQPSEQKARQQYEALITNFADLPLAGDARFELAELHSQRGEYDAALKLLGDALDKEPPPELSDKVRLRLGECYAAKGDMKAALGEFDAVAQNPKSPLAGQAQYRAGECHLQRKEYDKAVARLAVFRDQPAYQNLPGLTDRALLRLGHALTHLGQWDQGRQAFEQLVSRFGASPWVHEARYGIGWARQNLKQYDEAVNAYNQVTAGTATEIGAKAQLQVGVCRREQKRYAEAAVAFMTVPYTYDYPEVDAAALYEAGLNLIDLKQPEQAARLWQRVIQDYPKSEGAKVARERLEALKKG